VNAALERIGELAIPAHRTKIIHQPLGVVAVIGAWNYPALLTLSPLVNAIAVGNHVLVKPSELAPVTVEILRQMIREALEVTRKMPAPIPRILKFVKCEDIRTVDASTFKIVVGGLCSARSGGKK
jgi:acyl-CoA reductase-like NAD-dependent aldehyde dehydrogenase